MNQATAKPPDPQCPLCKGIGWYESPSYGNFAPRIDVYPCPDCNKVEPIGHTGCLLTVALLAVAIVVMVWGSR